MAYRWKTKKNIEWKGFSKSEAVPMNARPLTNGSWILNQNSESISSIPGIDGNAFLPRPIKHWRKQLTVDPSIGGTKSRLINISAPGSSIYLGGNYDRECCDNGGSSIISTIENKNNPCCQTTPIVIKSASTILSKTYYTDSRAYLRSRCKLYEQKLSTRRIPGNTYFDASGNELYPNDSKTGPQNYLMRNCANTCDINKQPKTIYKPNNRNFATQGAVSSSARLVKLKYDTVNKNGASFNSAYGQAASNAGRYSENGNAPYFIKSKISEPQIFYKKGTKVKCVC
jgi:hypothetical protein